MCRLRFNRAAAVVLVLTFGFLPVAAQALPSELPVAVLRLEARDWLDHLARALSGLWKKATSGTGMSMDPNGRPASAAADPARIPVRFEATEDGVTGLLGRSAGRSG